MRRLLLPASLLCLLAVAACPVDFEPIGPGGDPFPDFTPPEEVTPGPPLIVAPARTEGLLRSLDGGLVVRIGSDSLASLAALSGGELYPPIAVLEVSGSLREWMAPSTSGDPAAAATGTLATRVQEALDAGRYVALRVVAEDEDDLPVGLEIVGRPWSEPTLIRLASGFEAATSNRRVPETTPALAGESIDY